MTLQVNPRKGSWILGGSGFLRVRLFGVEGLLLGGLGF